MTTVNVNFRVFDEGDVIALWEEDGSNDKWLQSYQHIGQHSDASRELIDDLRPATQEEKASLISELNSIGYVVNDLDQE